MAVSENRLKQFWQELLRRRVARVAIIYTAAAWILIQVADVMLEAFELDPFLKYVIATLVAGLPLALVLSWMFDITPEGIQRTPAMDEADGEIPSIAVLPFENFSQDPGNEYFSDGLAEEIRAQLARVPGLRVAARTSSFAFKGKHQDARDIGRLLDVRLLLEGGVRKHEDKVRISAQLVDARRGYQVWSATYDRKLEDVFQIQSDISRSILEAVHVKLLQHHATRQPTESFEAYNLYLLGRHHFHRRTESALGRAVDYFKKAIAIDENFALAYSGLADAWSLLSTGFYGNRTAEQAAAEAVPAAERAMQLDPSSVEAHASLGLIRHTQGDYEGAVRSFERAILIDPEYLLAHVWLGMTLITQGRYSEARMRNAEALRLDPLSPIVNANAGFDALRFGDDREAEARFSAAIELDPGFPVPYSGMGRLHSRRGNLDEALTWINRAVERAPTRAFYLGRKGFLYLQLGQIERAEEWLDAALQHSTDPRFISDALLGLAITMEDRDHLAEVARGDFDSHPARFSPAQRGFAAWASGDPELALNLYEQHCPDHDALILAMINDDWLWRFPHSLNRAHLRLVHGCSDARADVESLLGKLDDALEGALLYAEIHYWKAAAFAVLGRDVDALAELSRAIDEGWRNNWYATHDPNLQSIRGHEEFARLARRVEKALAGHRERLGLKEGGPNQI